MSQPSEEEILKALHGPLMDHLDAMFLGILYGEMGTGKTTLGMKLAQAITPADKDIRFLDTGQGWVSLNDYPELKVRTRWNRYTAVSQIQHLAMAIRAGRAHPEIERYQEFGKIGTVVLDEMSTMSAMDLDLLTRNNAAKEEGKDPDSPEWSDRNAGDNRFRRAIYDLVAADVSIIALSHEREAKNKQKVTQLAPDFPDKLRGKVSHPMHFVGRLQSDLVEANSNDLTNTESQYRRMIQCHPTKLVMAKSRVQGLRIFETHETFVEGITNWMKVGGKLLEQPVPETTLPSEEIDVLGEQDV